MGSPGVEAMAIPMEATQEEAQWPTAVIRVNPLLEVLAALEDRALARAAPWELGVPGVALHRKHAKQLALVIKLLATPGLRG